MTLRPPDYVPPERLNVLFDEAAIAVAVERLAREIVETMGREIALIGLLKGSFVFTSDLVRALHRAGGAPQIDFMTLSSYGNEKTTSRHVNIVSDLVDDVAGQAVLLVDDILESGRTIHFAAELMRQRGAREVRTCVLLEKPNKRHLEIAPDFVGFRVPDRFVVGYGLDYANHYRELPFIGAID